MNTTIRRATIDDLKTIQQFGYQLLEYERNNWDPDLKLDWPFSDQGKNAYTKAINDGYTTIAEIDEKPVGFLIGSIKRPKVGNARQITVAQLENIFVNEDARVRGVGKKLADEFKTYCIAEKVDKLNVVVNSENVEAIKFYKKIGFIPSRMILSQDLNS